MTDKATETDEHKGQPKGLTKDALSGMLKDAISDSDVLKDVVNAAVDQAVAPLREKQTDLMERLQAGQERLGNAIRSTDGKTQGIAAARFVRAMAFGRGDLERAKHFCTKTWDDGLGDDIVKSLQAGDLTAGGALVPPEYAQEIIELLRPMSVVRAAGARTLPMNAGSLTLRKQTAGSTAAYVGESTNITKTQPTTGQIVMTSKKLAAIVPISNDLLQFSSSPSADEFVRDDLVLHIATREDQAFLRDDGTQDKPKGLRYWAQAANITATNGTSATNIETDCKDAINDLEGNDVRMIKPAWFMAPRSKNHLVNLRDANGNLIFPEIRGGSPTLYGWPAFVSTNIPTNLGSGGNESELYLVDMVDAIIAEASGLEIAVDSSASYVDSGSLVSAFSRDETLIRAISKHDFAVRHEESVAVKTGVTWGA